MFEQAKVLVCITPQSNSKRLIDKGIGLINENDGELHIVHVEKGQNVMFSEASSSLLQELFNYGASHGGIIHGLCGDNIVNTIEQFIKSEKITDIVLGIPPVFNPEVRSENVIEKLKSSMPYLRIVTLERD